MPTTPPFQRLFKLLFATSAAGVILAITLFFLSTRYTTYYTFSSNIASLAPGSLDLTHAVPGRSFLCIPEGFSTAASQAPTNWLPRADINVALWTFSIPLWLPALLFSLLALATYRRAFITPGLCRKCNYSLEGLEDPERCPECGQQLVKNDSAHRPQILSAGI